MTCNKCGSYMRETSRLTRDQRPGRYVCPICNKEEHDRYKAEGLEIERRLTEAKERVAADKAAIRKAFKKTGLKLDKPYKSRIRGWSNFYGDYELTGRALWHWTQEAAIVIHNKGDRDKARAVLDAAGLQHVEVK